MIRRSTTSWARSAAALLSIAIGGCAAEVGTEGVGAGQEALACSTGFNHDYAFDDLTFEWDGYPSRVTTALSAGGYVTVNTVTHGDSLDVLLTRVDGAGAVVWSRRIGHSTRDEEGRSVVESHDGMHVVFTGRYGGQVLVGKVRLDGVVMWTRSYGEPNVAGVQNNEQGSTILRHDDFGGYLVLGTAVQNADPSRLYLLWIDDNGNQQWAYRYVPAAGAGVQDRSIGMTIDPGGVVWLAAQNYEPAAGPSRLGLMPVRPGTGHSDNMHVYPDPTGGSMTVGDVVALRDGGFAAVWTRATEVSNSINVLRIQADMSPLGGVTHRYGPADGSQWAAGWTLHPTPAGGFDVSTSILASPTEGVAGLLRIDAAWNPVGHRRYGDLVPWITDVSPMEPVPGGYVLRSQSGSRLMLTAVDATGSGCCQEFDHFEHVEPPIGHVVLPLHTDQPWGLEFAEALPVVNEIPTVTSCR